MTAVRIKKYYTAIVEAMNGRPAQPQFTSMVKTLQKTLSPATGAKGYP